MRLVLDRIETGSTSGVRTPPTGVTFKLVKL
jgi:hypothetical protein